MSGMFDLSGMTMDASALEGLDLSAMDFSGLDLSGLDLSGLDMSGLDLSQILSRVAFNATPEQLSALAEQLLAGYRDYAAGNPEADFTRLGEYFLTYLQSDEAKAALADALDRLLEESGLTVSA